MGKRQNRKSEFFRFPGGWNCFECLFTFPSFSFFPPRECYVPKHCLEKIILKGKFLLQNMFSWVTFSSLTFLVCLQLQVYDNGSLWEWPSENIWSKCQKVFSENCLAAKLKNCMWATFFLFFKKFDFNTVMASLCWSSVLCWLLLGTALTYFVWYFRSWIFWNIFTSTSMYTEISRPQIFFWATRILTR